MLQSVRCSTLARARGSTTLKASIAIKVAPRPSKCSAEHSQAEPLQAKPSQAEPSQAKPSQAEPCQALAFAG